MHENCPDILKQEGKVEIERIHRSPPTFNPQLTTPRNIIAKLKNYQTKGKILQAAKKKPFRCQGTTVRKTGSGCIYIEGPEGREYNILESKGTGSTTRNQLSSKTDYILAVESMVI